MKQNFQKSLSLVLAHEGGYVNHPRDPGGATNKGITIGTLKSVGIDVDGDGDSDIVDLKNLRQRDLEYVYRKFYWDVVKGDDLPPGVDYVTFDLAVNSGVGRAVKYLQECSGAKVDGTMGQMTLIRVAEQNPATLAAAICDRRLVFLKGLKTWSTFGGGWGRRVAECRAHGVEMAKAPPPSVAAEKPKPPEIIRTENEQIVSRETKTDIEKTPNTNPTSVLALIKSMFGKKDV